MAEMEVKSGGGKKGPGVKKGKKQSTRVDLTPMVDLGFLLITFFMFTTTLSSPTAMKLNMPDETAKPEEQNEAAKSGAFTVILGKADQVYYYEGDDPKTMQVTNLKGIRDKILDKKSRTPADKLVVIIKPDQDATYKDAVDLLDEMTINEIGKYAMVTVRPDEYSLVQQTEVANGIK
ncbi:ExbD/TolR family protein [Dinghuibacter silviterrae]|uniref:Outer membrane transport energization protein ExbD n=1 Tax=Dinghuibacter silviterrae TaxID=1539049 RepID=A0A4R8DNJ7_9BACT|nr:biopolymer transporter ExbD [Dinghuibacter silviterrae]TDW99277.1 outer membrane transport energization protein ExbD [Dinghuibacter silviterrae]